MLARAFTPLCFLLPSVLAGCFGGNLPAVTEARASGQSALMSETFAGQNACNPDDHDRPFIIEWDATDMSMFEGRAATDVVFVQYEGCKLRVLDGCANDAVRGTLGAYRPVEWTSGSVEKIDIRDEGELYAKLPLGAASLGGRVHAGEKFTMEYFVSGIRTATRSAVTRGELEKIQGCAGATHFVYGYALGAFELGSASEIGANAQVEVKDVGLGGGRTKQQSAEKRGGLLASCRADSAKETKTCQVPIRLMLRGIASGPAPESAVAAGPNGEPPTRSDRAEITVEETKLRESAARKRVAKDGRGCIADLDAADRQFPNSPRLSTRPDGMMNIRAECLMLSGECDPGKRQLRMAYEHLGMKTDQIDVVVASIASDLCPKS